MQKGLKKSIAFVLTAVLAIGSAAVPVFADDTDTADSADTTVNIYKEASLSNGLDTGFEKQSEIQKVKTDTVNGLRTLSKEAHTGRFSLSIGGTNSPKTLVCITDAEIDLAKFNQVTMWIKAKGISKFSIYTKVQGTETLIGETGSIEQGAWQQVTFTLSGIKGGKASGLYTYAEGSRKVLIDDICYTKSYQKTEQWDLTGGALDANTLSTLKPYLSDSAKSMSSSMSNMLITNNSINVAYIENAVAGQITGIKIDSSNAGSQTTLVPTGSAVYIDCIPATSSAIYALSGDGKVAYYRDDNSGMIIRKDYTTNDTDFVTKGKVQRLITNEDGSLLVILDDKGSLYYYDAGIAKTNSAYTLLEFRKIAAQTDIAGEKVSSGAITSVSVKGDLIYYTTNDNFLYLVKKGETEGTMIGAMYSERYTYYVSSYYYKHSKSNKGYGFQLMRHDTQLGGADTSVFNLGEYGWWTPPYSVVKTNSKGSMVLCQINGSYYVIMDANTAAPKAISLGTSIAGPSFLGDRLFYTVGTQIYKADKINQTPVPVNGINYINNVIDANETGDKILFADTNILYQITKTFSYDKEQVVDFMPGTDSTITSSSAIARVKFSSLPNQAVVQMQNGDIYAVDLRTKTSRLLVNGMILQDVLSDGTLLLSDMKDTGRFLIYNPTTSDKKVFRLDNRNTTDAFRMTYNEADKIVYYVNKDGKMQQLLLTGAESKDRYAFMLNNDGNWWSFRDNAWKNIYSGTGNPDAEIMDSLGMSAEEANAITEKEFKLLTANVGEGTLRIAVFFSTNSAQAIPELKGITITTEDTEGYLDSITAYGIRLSEYKKADYRSISAIHIVENKDKADEVYYFLIANDMPYSIRDGEVCNINGSATDLFADAKGKFMDILSYGMSAQELAALTEAQLKKILIDDNKGETFGIAAVIKAVDKDTDKVKLSYTLESLAKRFDDSVKTVSILLNDDTKLEYTEGQVTKEEIEQFADWVADRKYNRGPVFFTFHVGGKYKVINYYSIKMFSVE